MLLFIRLKFRTLIRYVRKWQAAYLFPLYFVVVLVAMLFILSYPAATVSPNPYQEEGELFWPVLPLPYSPDELQYFDEAFTGFLQQQGFNGTALVARHGMVIYKKAFGYADFRSRLPLTEDTSFQLASISKTFTAAAVLLLQEDGLLQIDDPVMQYIPEFPYPQITIRHLLNHTSGLQNYMWLVERVWKEERLPGNEDLVGLFARHKTPVGFAAGTRFAYSNTGYAFLALVVERVSGKAFATFLKSRIFDPLDMQNTYAYCPRDAASLPGNRALGFTPGRRSYIFNADVQHDGVLGDKGIYASVNDLFKWDQAIYRHALLSPGTWEEAFTHAVLKNTRTVDYGHGWRLQTFLDGRVVHHPGRWNGFRTSFKRFIDNRATLILLSNDGRSIGPVVDGMQNILFHREIASLSEQPAAETKSYEEDSYGN